MNTAPQHATAKASAHAKGRSQARARSRFFALYEREEVNKSGESGESGELAALPAQPSKLIQAPNCVLAIPKRQAKAAVRRNLIKRLAREALQLEPVAMPATLVFRSGAELQACKSASSAPLKRLLRQDLQRLFASMAQHALKSGRGETRTASIPSGLSAMAVASAVSLPKS